MRRLRIARNIKGDEHLVRSGLQLPRVPILNTDIDCFQKHYLQILTSSRDFRRKALTALVSSRI